MQFFSCQQREGIKTIKSFKSGASLQLSNAWPYTGVECRCVHPFPFNQWHWKLDLSLSFCVSLFSLVLIDLPFRFDILFWNYNVDTLHKLVTWCSSSVFLYIKVFGAVKIEFDIFDARWKASSSLSLSSSHPSFVKGKYMSAQRRISKCIISLAVDNWLRSNGAIKIIFGKW